jgi:hypothetical protein
MYSYIRAARSYSFIFCWLHIYAVTSTGSKEEKLSAFVLVGGAGTALLGLSLPGCRRGRLAELNLGQVAFPLSLVAPAALVQIRKRWSKYFFLDSRILNSWVQSNFSQLHWPRRAIHGGPKKRYADTMLPRVSITLQCGHEDGWFPCPSILWKYVRTPFLFQAAQFILGWK